MDLVTAVLLLVFLGASCRDRVDSRPRDAPKGPVVLLGVDGLSWTVMEPMIETGELPNFASLRENGAVMLPFDTMGVTESPVVWTTVATGRAPEDHGVLDFVERLPDGERIPISSSSRREKAIWNVATDRGVSVGVVGWWASWPAEPVDGYVITDHANRMLSSFFVEDGTYWTADPRRIAALAPDVYPPDLGETLEPFWVTPETIDWEELRERGGFRPSQLTDLREAPWNDRSPHSVLKTFYAVDKSVVDIGIHLLEHRPTDLTLLYIRGPDPIQHYAWDLVEPEKFARGVPHLVRDRGLVRGVYRYVDSFLGEILGALPADAWLIVASDHGAEAPPRAADPSWRGRPGVHGPEARGVLFISGPHVRSGHRLDRGDPRDLMPTMAWLAGLPISDELVGTPLLDAFDPRWARAHRPLRTPTYGSRGRIPEAEPSAADEGMLESLRTLGYVD